MSDLIGQQFGNYNLVCFLGRGSFAEVYLGEHTYLHTQAALKILHARLMDKHKQDFLQEAQIIARLKHPHIVQILEFAVQEGIPFLVMTYAPHGSLRTLHPTGTILPVRTILNYVRNAANALQFAHDQKLIHRDIKPGNLLVAADHGILLSDFGLATVIQSSQHQSLLEVAGTVTYMAPEQLQGRPCAASDQYALAVTVYEWLCGAPPFTGTREWIAAQHIMASPPSLREKVPTSSPAVEQVVLKALNKDPRQRFPTVSAFATALEQAAQDKKPPSLRESETVPESLLPLSRQQVGRSQPHPLIGREQERQCWHQLFLDREQCRSHIPTAPTTALWEKPAHASCLFFSGEAGIGKTRLAEEMSREAQRRGWSVAWSRLYAQERYLPYHLWTEALRAALSQGLWSQWEGNQSPLVYQPLTALLPELADLLHPEPLPSGSTPGNEQLRIWETVLMVLTAICKRKPLLLVLDDLQYADTMSCELLAYLARRLSQYPLLIVGTYRDHEIASTHPFSPLIAQLQREQVLVIRQISALTDPQIEELISGAPQALVRRIQQQAAGNPFFAEELARAFSKEEGKDKNTPRTSRGSVALPETITAVLNQRVRQLSRPCQHFLSCAAVLGNAFTFPMLRLMTSSESSSADEEGLLSLLDEALQARMLTEEGHGTWITYHFWHPLLISHVYQKISATRRTVLHRKAADALRQVYATREAKGAALILHHLLQSDAETRQVAHYAELAGHHAYALAAYPEAERYYRVALEQGEGITVTWPRGKWLSVTNGNEQRDYLTYLLECLGDCLRFQGKPREARDLYQQVLQIHDQPDTSGSAFEQQEKAQFEAMLWCEIGVTWYDTGDHEQALQCYQQSEQILMKAEVLGGPVWAYTRHQQSSIHWRRGNYKAAQHAALEALRLFNEGSIQQNYQAETSRLTRMRRVLAGDLVELGRIHALLGMIANGAGQCTQALNYLKTALELYEQCKSQREIAIVCCNLGDAYLRKAEHGLAEAFFHRSLSIAEQIGEIPLVGLNLGNLGVLASRSGNLVKAEAWLRRGITLLEHGNAPVLYVSLLHSSLATILLELDKLSEARTSIHHALLLARHLHLAPCTGIVLVALGRMRLAQAIDIDSSEESAELSNRESTRILKRTKKTLQRALAIEELETETRVKGQVYLAQAMLLLGEAEEARQVAIQSLEQANQHELTWLVARVQRLLGCIMDALGLSAEATRHFEQALHISQKSGMHLEYAYTLYQYGLIFLQQNESGEEQYQRGLTYQREARSLFIENHAQFHLRLVERALAGYTDTFSNRTHSVGC